MPFFKNVEIESSTVGGSTQIEEQRPEFFNGGKIANVTQRLLPVFGGLWKKGNEH